MNNNRLQYCGGTPLRRILFGFIAMGAVAWLAVSQADSAGTMVGAVVASQESIVAAESDVPGVSAKRVAWAGRGKYRVLLEVAPVELGERKQDELPAQVDIDWLSLLESLDVKDKADLRTLQVMRFNPETGRPVLYSDYAYQRGPYDRSFRWYDAAIPYDFPEVLAPTSRTDGVRKRITNERTGYLYNAVGDWESGKLSWTHTQEADAPSYYAVYFDVMDRVASPPAAPPRGWIGDAMLRHERWGRTTTGADNAQVALDDWNDDGLFDLVYGEQYGQTLVLINTGTAERPTFGPGRMLFDSDSMPLDSGMHASPLVIDWNGDGVKDLLIGTYQNRIAFYRNTGTNRDRMLEYQGFLRDATGEFLALPITPVAAKSEGVFKEDYYPAISAVDWDGDGDTDLLCGGYITGRVYFFRNTGRKDDLPVLELVGPIEADGEPINVKDWCAAPCASDFNGDGLLDLVVGSYTWHPDAIQRPSFLRYYVNQGTPSSPDLRELPLPVRGEITRMRLPNPRATDFNSDGLLDLVVSTGANIILYPNVGSASEPLFDLDQKPIRTAWGNAAAQVGHQILDWNNDGWPDLVSRYTVHLNSGVGKPYFWNRTAAVLPEGVNIDHPVDKGDGHFYPYLHDLDHDGQTDVLFGDWHGHVWFHRQQGKSHEPRFDLQGLKLLTTDGSPIKVGPVEGDAESSFQVLQGARTSLVAGDYNGDGRDDLIVGDTYGKIRYYQNIGPAELPRFALPELIADLKTRLKVEKVDWNRDGRLDVLASMSSHKIYVLLNEGSAETVHFGDAVALPLKVKGPTAMVADLNRDGDEDLLINGTQGTSFAERSFIDHGYAPARVLGVDTIDTNTKH